MCGRSYVIYPRLTLPRLYNKFGAPCEFFSWLKIQQRPQVDRTLQRMFEPRSVGIGFENLCHYHQFVVKLQRCFFSVKVSLENGLDLSKSCAHSKRKARRGQMCSHFGSTSATFGKYTLATGWNLSSISKKKPIIFFEKNIFL